MGLTIHYGLRFAGSVADARTLVKRLQNRAFNLPFQEVSPLVELSGPACNLEQVDRDNPNRWLVVQAAQHIQKKGHYLQVPPKRLIAFTTLPGEGCESANFGVAVYPATVATDDGQKVRTGLRGWSWDSFCKTQYASDPAAGGVENFVRCHLSVVKLLDYARELGFTVDVNDEGGFWERRDLKALVQEVGEWNAMIAGFVGRMRDQFGGDVEAPIMKYSTFEHREARGRAGEVGS